MPTISDDVILSIPIEENADTLLDLRQHKEFVLHAELAELPDESTFVRAEVLQRLLRASDSLEDCRIMIFGCYRPLWLQRQYFDAYANKLARVYPDYTSAQIVHETSKYVAPPTITPPHCTGGAIDLTLCNIDGTELDMGAKVDATPLESNNLVYTDASGLSDEARHHRKLLIDAMSGAGFVNYPYEFWHWSYGDRYWAYQSHQRAAKFGAAFTH